MRVVRRAGVGLAGLILLATLGSITARAEETILSFTRSTRTMAYNGHDRRPAVVDTSRAKVTLCLGDRYFKFYDADAIWVFDFDRRRVWHVDPRERVYSDWSLFAYVAFNEMQLARHLGLRDNQDGAPPPGTSILELESRYGMTSKETRPSPRETLADSSSGRQVRVLINGRVSASATASEVALTPARAHMLELFLLYRAQLHPRSRQAVMRLGHVPEVLFWRSQEGARETVVLMQLTSTTTAPENTDPKAGCRREDAPQPELAALARGLRASRARCSDTSRAAWMAESRRQESRALEDHHYLDASLVGLERSMWDCGRPSSQTWPAEVIQSARADSALMAYIAASRWSDSQTAHESIARLRALVRDSLQSAHVLDFVAAKARYSMEDYEGGVELTLAGLEKSPCAIDGWMDLSSAYLKGYQTVLAWICLDHARTIAPPTCPLVGDGTRFEGELMERHPEYF